MKRAPLHLLTIVACLAASGCRYSRFGKHVRIKLGDSTSRTLGVALPATTAEYPFQLRGPVRVEVELPTGMVLPLPADVVTVRQEDGHVASVRVARSAGLTDFQQAVAVVRKMSTDAGLGGSTRIGAKIAEWSSKQPPLDIAANYVASDCLPGGVGATFSIAAAMDVKTWEASTDIAPNDRCPGAPVARAPEKRLRVKFGEPVATVRAAAGAADPGPELPVDIHGATRLEVELPTGAVLAVSADHMWIRQDKGLVASVAVFPADRLPDFQDGVVMVRKLANDFGLGSSAKVAKTIRQWSNQQPDMDFFDRHQVWDCVPGGVSVDFRIQPNADFRIRPNVGAKTWSLSVDIAPFSGCPQISQSAP